MGCYGIIDFDTEKTILFVPKTDEMLQIWMTILTIDEVKQKYYLIDEIRYDDEIDTYLEQRGVDTVYLNLGVNSDSGLTTVVPEEKLYINHCKTVNKTDMHDILCESRVYKNDEEI